MVISDDGNEGLEREGVGTAVKAMALQVLNMGTARKDVREDTCLNLGGVGCDVLNVLESSLTVITRNKVWHGGDDHMC